MLSIFDKRRKIVQWKKKLRLWNKFFDSHEKTKKNAHPFTKVPPAARD
jgi:hypothetical protein